MNKFVPIQHRKRAKQIYDYTGLDWGKLSPTDIDGLVEIANKGYIIIELKRPNANFPYGQRLAMERMVDDFIKAGKKALLVLAENYQEDPEKDVVVADCKILHEYDGKWKKATHEKVRDVVEEWLYREKKIKEEIFMNTWNGIGRLTKDPQISYTASQTAVCKFTLAIDRFSAKEKATDFIPITVFGKQAENCGMYLAKGRMAGVTGRVQTGSYQKQDGSKVYTTDIIADRVDFLNTGTESRQGNAQSVKEMHRTDEQVEIADFEAIEEDVPF